MDSADTDYLVLSRGQWRSDVSAAQIQAGIDAFYLWFDDMVAQGRLRAGSRLQPAAALVHAGGLVTDGPFTESKELIGGFWFVRADSLQAAARILADSPTLPLGLHYEVRPLQPARARADQPGCEGSRSG